MTMRKRFIPRLLSLALVFLLALTMAVPAFAADNLTITIKNAEGLPAMTQGQFTAYQIFKGTPNKDKELAESNDWNASSWNNWSLADIQWGSGISTPESLITALKAANSETWPEFYSGEDNLFKGITYAAETPDASAEAVADILAKHTDNAFLQAFSEFVVHGSSRGQGGQGFVSGGTTSTANNVKDHPEDDTSTITVTEPGYYLVTEKHPTEANAVESEFILAVLGNQEIDLKADIPDVEKDIVKADRTTAKGDVAGVGDKVTFRLTGTVAKDIDIYDTYKYVFTDTLSKGLTYQYDAKVYVVRSDGTKKEITEGFTFSPEKPDPITTPSTDTTITITCNDLKNIKVQDIADFEIQGTDQIVVEYTAILNENAVVGSSGNLNSVTLEYSNNPHADGTGETTTNPTHVFSFGLDLTKVGSDKPDTGLAGASFVLKKGETDNVQYAKFKDQYVLTVKTTKDGATTTTQSFFDTQELADAAAEEAKQDPQEGTTVDTTVNGPVRRLTEWVEESAFESAGDDKAKNFYLTSGSDGAIPDVYGLDAGTYTLQEVVTPVGYNTMDDYSFTIEAKINEQSGALESVTYTSPTTPEITYAGDGLPAFKSGLLPDTLVNQKAPLLPFTGGIGTVIFYVLGGLLIAGAVTYLVIASKKRKKTEENA